MSPNASPSVVVQHLPANRKGRDFVLSDVHGCRNTLERLLNRVQFNAARDRVLSVGDLIDRGPESMACLDFLDEPWFYAVQGNHEQMLLHFCAPSVVLGGRVVWDEHDDFLANGGSWIERELVDRRRRLGTRLMEVLETIGRLPHILVVGEGTERYQVIHAELSYASLNHDPPVYGDREIDRAFKNLGPGELEQLCETLSWGRRIMHLNATRSWPERHPDLSLTYCGHTPASEIRRRLSHVCIDTGSYLPFVSVGRRDQEWGLTMVDPATDTVYFAQTDERPGWAAWHGRPHR